MADSTSDEQFKILQREIRESIRRNHPNPERIGCPGSEKLRGMANSTIPPSDPAYKHVMECSPCYEELMEFSVATEARKSESISRRRRILVSAMAAGVVIAAIATYVVYTDGRSQPRHPDQIAGGGNSKQPSQRSGSADGLAVAMLNLDSETSLRSNGDQPRTTELQRLPRKRLDLTINLPRGLEAGTYELVLSKNDGPPLLTLTGEAKIEGGADDAACSAGLISIGPRTVSFADSARRISVAGFPSHAVLTTDLGGRLSRDRKPAPEVLVPRSPRRDNAHFVSFRQKAHLRPDRRE